MLKMYILLVSSVVIVYWINFLILCLFLKTVNKAINDHRIFNILRPTFLLLFYFYFFYINFYALVLFPIFLYIKYIYRDSMIATKRIAGLK